MKDAELQRLIERRIIAAERKAAEEMRQRCIDFVADYQRRGFFEDALRALPLPGDKS